MSVWLSLSITQNTQSIENNTSNVTVAVKAHWNTVSWDWDGAPGWLNIDGTKYTFDVKLNPNKTGSGSQTLLSKTVNVAHNSDGTKKLSCSASYTTGTASGTVAASASKDLTTIPRKSTLTVANGTLGTAQTLTITEKASAFKHKLKYVCGDVSGWILGDSDSFSTSNSVSWTPPLSLAQQNKTGTSVSVTFTLYTYTSDGTSVGSNSYTKTFSIPSSVKPSVSLAVSDPTGYADDYGAYIQGASKLKIVVTASGDQGSTIKSYKTAADGKTYTAATVTTGVIAGSGTLTITATVTDSRGRTATASKTISVLAYEPPKITELTAYRSDADGNANSSGAYLAVSFSVESTSLDGRNSISYVIQYKRSKDEGSTTAAIQDSVFVFPAETSSSYDIVLIVGDDFKATSKTTTGASVKKVCSLLKKAGEIVGIAFNKVAEFEGVFEIGFQTMFTGGILHPVLEPGTDLDDVRTPNTYVGANVSNYHYENCPMTTGTFALEVVGMGEEGQVKQRLTYCHKTAARSWERIYYGSAWGEWVCVSDFGGNLLWSGEYYMTEGHTATLSELVSNQRSGIVLVFSLYDKDEGSAKNQEFFEFFVPKYTILEHSGSGRNFNLCGMFGNGVKYLYLHNDKIVGYSKNKETQTIGGITYDNSRYVLRCVIGV